MARISTYSNDTTIRDNDLLIGTDGGTGAAGSSGQTKNFPLTGLREYFIGAALTDGFIPRFDASVGRFVNSAINFSPEGELIIPGNVQLTGTISNPDGEVLLGGTGSEEPISQPYETAIPTSGTNLDIYTVHVFTSSGMYNLPASPPDGAWVKIVNLSGVSNVILNAGPGFRFMNSNGGSLLTLDDQTASFELVYVNKPMSPNAPVGWVIVGAN